jgi:outer membrane immunogenic protein
LLSSVRGRLGFAANNWLFYVTGGGAWRHADTDRTITCTGAGCPGVSTNSVLVGQVASVSGTVSGWTVGGGFEYGIAPNWSLKLEYLYYNFKAGNDFAYTSPTAFRHIDSELQLHTVKLGVNYRFNWGSGIAY